MKIRDIVDPLVFFGAIAAIWEFGVRALDMPKYLLTPLSDVLIVGWSRRGRLWQDSLITLEEVVYGFALAVVVGTMIAVMIYYFPTARRTLYPFVTGMQALPKVALAPLMIVWFGYGISSKVVMAFLFAFFPVVISTLGGLNSTPPHLEEHFRALRASGWSTFWRLRVPSALPNFLDGCKVAMPLAVIGAIVGEFVGSESGLGYLILLAAGVADTSLMFATLIVVTVLSMLLYGLLQIAGRWIWWRSY